MSKLGLWYDDWLIIAASCCATACLASAIWIVTVLRLKPDPGDYARSLRAVSDVLKGTFISEICWTIAICIVKCSILTFYWRLFRLQGGAVRIAIWAFFVVVVCWGIAVGVATIFQCSPIQYMWEPTIPGRCITDTYWFFVGSSIPHIITDLALIGLPMPRIWKLQMPRSQKITVSAILGLGGLVTVVSFFRVINLTRSNGEKATNEVSLLIWTGVEVNMSIVCACLPCLRPIITLIFGKLKSLREHKSTHERGSELPMDMLKLDSPAAVLAVSRQQSWGEGERPMLDSSADAEDGAPGHVDLGD
ncbi:hypothetical protein HO173_012083 [Letharia columbiana]|uniref:Rhodopsin domain-containing protein n=1 Tax=Letharia columbiana TaxID=112416 RepID=A0A8H6FH35_9LECA|nr:uncharacterized protein HO173_012083 [Letharia columbiana]KAF6227643.1 hypothetical protein HO173_012083 [Letharia columbiana]